MASVYAKIGISVAITVISSLLGKITELILTPVMRMAQSTGWLDPDTYSVMSEYCEDLTEIAKNNMENEKRAKENGKPEEKNKKEIHDVIGRDKEIATLIDILSRNGKGNPCVVGDSGVGKTALVEGLAYRIAHGNVPDDFKNKKIIKVNMVNLIAGRSYNNGDGAVSRMRALFDKASKDKDIVLFMDEFHQVVQCNAAELFKTYLDRGQVKVIAATTTSEYSHISKDPALERRFTRVLLNEPNQSETLEIIKGLKNTFEKGTTIKISDEAMIASVELTGRYMPVKSYPDKAIDAIGFAIRSVARKSTPGKLVTVTAEDIRRVVSAETHIPIDTITEREAQAMATMEGRVKRHVAGQNEAVKLVCDAIKRGRAGIADPHKPRASFFFTGLPGVGKTLLAESIGEEVGSFIKIDMSQYNTANSVAELTGSKIQGYKGELVEKVWKNPYSVILFDGIEKASPQVCNVILEILDKGYLVNSAGNKVDFTNSIIIMTSGVGSEVIFNADENSDKFHVKKEVLKRTTQVFGPEFLSKVSNTVIFNKLTSKNFEEMSEMFIGYFEDRLARENIRLEINDDVKKYISCVEVNHFQGSRQLKRRVEKKLEKPIADLIINRKLKKGDTVVCSVGDNEINFEVKR